MRARWIPGPALLMVLCAGCLEWVRWEGPRTAMPVCHPERELARLDSTPQPGLRWVDRKLAFLSTPFKRRGISGWRPTYCTASAVGRLVRDPQYSTDGFWTMDIALDSVRIGPTSANAAGRFMRIEVEPRTQARTVVERLRPKRGALLRVSGVLVLDTDRDDFLEIHPDSDLVVLDSVVPALAASTHR